MSIRMPFLCNLMAVGSSLLLGGCAATTPPPQFTAVSPADPAAPESAVPPPVALLTGGGELSEGATKADDSPSPPAPAASSGVQSGPEHAMTEGAAVYTCLMHPEVAAKEPGKCPICRMTLTKKAKAPKEKP